MRVSVMVPDLSKTKRIFFIFGGARRGPIGPPLFRMHLVEPGTCKMLYPRLEHRYPPDLYSSRGVETLDPHHNETFKGLGNWMTRPREIYIMKLCFTCQEPCALGC